MADRATDGINEGGTAPHCIFIAGHLLDLTQPDPVMKHFAHVVKENGGHKTFARLLALLVDQGIEAANRVAFQPSHGTAPVQNEYQFCHVVSHNKTSTK